MAKLTNYQRDQITRAIILQTFEARRHALVKREAALATRVVLHRYGRDCFKRFDAVPVGWLPTIKEILVQYGNNTRSLKLAEARALPSELYHGGAYELPDDLARLVVVLDELYDNLAKDTKKLHHDLRSALRGFSTEAMLRTEWPEGYSALTVPEVTNHAVPVVRVEQIRQEIAAMKEAA